MPIPPTMTTTQSKFKMPAPVSHSSETGTSKPSSSSFTGPVGSSSASSGSSGAPSPVTVNSPVGGGYGSAGGRGAAGSGGTSSYGRGNPGNPGMGSGPPGINARRDPDFGPYMAELQRRIKRNWQPPKQNNSKRVVLMFKIGRDGRLLGLSVARSSGDPEADRSAMSAVQLTAPFRPLPAEYTNNSIDIQFTFDYNVFGIGGGLR